MALSKADKHITDPLLQNELRWQKYSLRQGAWDDNITMQAISYMLSVTINVLSSHHPVYSVTPTNGYVANEIFIGLIMQYHYVGLDTIPQVQAVDIEPTQPVKTDTVVQQPEQSEPVPDNELDDTTVTAGDEHRIQISGASIMCVENPESFRHTMCVAPAEGEKPVNIMTDVHFEAMSNPDKFP